MVVAVRLLLAAAVLAGAEATNKMQQQILVAAPVVQTIIIAAIAQAVVPASSLFAIRRQLNSLVVLFPRQAPASFTRSQVLGLLLQ
jgi:hypothetical protein